MSAAGVGRVFISYRRQEASGLAGRLYDRLAARFGEDQVFMDVDTITLGVDFAEAITQAVSTCEVLLAVIGPRWLTATDEDGRRRLEDPDDLVRLEVGAALERGIRVIPILVEGAGMPRRQELPEALAGLARRNALSLRHESFRSDAERLLAAIGPVLRPPAAPAPPRETGYAVAGADDFLAVIPTAPNDQQPFLRRLAEWAVALEARGLAQLTTHHGETGITTLVPRLSDGPGLVTVYKDTRSSYLELSRSVFERRAPRSLAAAEAAIGGPGVGRGSTVREASDELLAALTAAYEETGQPAAGSSSDRPAASRVLSPADASPAGPHDGDAPLRRSLLAALTEVSAFPPVERDDYTSVGDRPVWAFVDRRVGGLQVKFRVAAPYRAAEVICGRLVASGVDAQVKPVRSRSGSIRLWVRLGGPADLAALRRELPALWRDYQQL
jgi:TIR domain